MYMFGLGNGWLPAEADRIARKHGAELINHTDAQCGKIEELRPYGPRGESICFDCAMKDEATTNRQMDRVLFGKEIQ